MTNGDSPTEPGSAAEPAPAAGPDSAAGPDLAADRHPAGGHVVAGELRPPSAGALTNAITATTVIAVGAAALVGSLSLGVGTARTPGPGLWPLLVSAVLIVLGSALLAAARHTRDAERFTRTSWLVLAGLATMVGFVAVVDVIGFEIPAALLCFVWLRFLGRMSWRTSIVASLAVVLACYLVFVAALAVPIPHLF